MFNIELVLPIAISSNVVVSNAPWIKLSLTKKKKERKEKYVGNGSKFQTNSQNPLNFDFEIRIKYYKRKINKCLFKLTNKLEHYEFPGCFFFL